MKLNSFFIHQEEINKHIAMDKSLNSYKLTARKHLALQVKISDLANETRCFVYWQSKDSSVSRETVLEKYMDCFSLILTIGLDKGYQSLESIIVKPNDYCLSDQFLNLLIDINDLIISPSIDHYNTLFEDFISLGISLGISINTIEEHFFNNNISKIAL